MATITDGMKVLMIKDYVDTTERKSGRNNDKQEYASAADLLTYINESNNLSNLMLSEIAQKSLDNLKTCRYRNLEGDMMLPSEDYDGIIRPIETPIKCLSYSDVFVPNVVILQFIGTTGTAVFNYAGLEKTITASGDVDVDMDGFVTDNAAAFDAVGVTLTYDGDNYQLVFTDESLVPFADPFLSDVSDDYELSDIEREGGQEPLETNTIIIANLPRIQSLLDNPEKWLLFVDSSAASSGVKITAVEYTGDVVFDGTTYKDCYTATLNTDIIVTGGVKIGVCSFMSNGLNIRYTPAIPINTGEWGRTTTCATFKHSDGTYRMIASLEMADNDAPFKYILKQFKAVDPMEGDWEIVNDAPSKQEWAMELDGISGSADITCEVGEDVIGGTIEITEDLMGALTAYVAEFEADFESAGIDIYVDGDPILRFKSIEYGVTIPVPEFTAIDGDLQVIDLELSVIKDAHESDFKDIFPLGYNALFTYGLFKLPGTESMYCTAVGLVNDTVEPGFPNGLCDKIGFLVFDENLNHQRLVIPTITHEYDYYINKSGYGNSVAFFGGKYYISIHDGDAIGIDPFNYGKRLLFVSDTLEGPYVIDSTIADGVDLVYPGSLFNYSFTNSSLFVYNGEMYYVATGSKTASDHEVYLFKYNQALKTWNLLPFPVVTALYGVSTNYPDLPSMAWGRVHVGAIQFGFIEGNKLWIGYNATSSGYTAGYGYIDLNVALK